MKLPPHPPAVDAGSRLVMIYIPLACLLLTAAYVLAEYLETRVRLERQTQEETVRLRLVANTMQDALAPLLADVRILAEADALAGYLQSDTADSRQRLENLFHVTARHRPLYSQIRFIDQTGQERVRVSRAPAGVERVPPAQLQNKADRRYFRQTLARPPGEVYLSPMDLKMEGGVIERPFVPILRAATPVRDPAGEVRGLVVINYRAQHLLGVFAEAMRGSWGRPMLLNRDGYWLYSTDPQDTWGFLLDHGRRFPDRFPEAWTWIETTQTAQVSTPEGLFTFFNFYPLGERWAAEQAGPQPARPEGRIWRLVSYAPAPVLWSHLRQSLAGDWLILATLLLAGVVVGSLLARARQRELASRERFRRLVELQPDALLVHQNRLCIYANPAALQLLGAAAPAALLGRPVIDLIAPKSRPLVLQRMQQVRQGLDPPAQELDILRLDGRIVPVEARASAIRYAGRPSTMVILRDITERRRAERLREELISSIREELHASEERFRVALKGSPVTVFNQDRGLCYTWIGNPNAGFIDQTAIGRRDRELLENPLEAEVLEALKQRLLEAGSGVRQEITVTRQGGVRHYDLTLEALRDASGAIAGLTGAAFDITERKSYEAQLAYQANYDSLTGLPNRALLHDRLRHAIAHARRVNRWVAVMFMDLDHFKRINDTLGHGVGDGLLKVVAANLRASLREEDTVARLGGDEFVLLLEGLTAAEPAAHVAAKVLATLEKPVIVDDHKLFVTGSIGISLFPRDGQDVETLLKHADVALYRSKEQGRNSFHFYAPAMNARTLDRLLLERDLRQALEQEQLEVHYQPLLDLSSDRIASVEALLRWRHPQRGLLPPDVFIPLAEETGLIVAIGGWVLHTACAQIRAWQDAGLPPVRVAVNLSVRQFTQPDLVQRVGWVLQQTHLEPSRLTLEITESLLMQDIDKAAATLRALKAMGVRLAIDDFGTGYSSLHYLKHLPFDRLKIDKSLVRDIEIDPNDSAIAAAVIAMAHSLRLQVVAEGIEDEVQLTFLKSNGCDEGQGFHFSEPRPAADIAALLAGQRARRPASAAR